jgi:hypothetical protein
VQVIFSNYFANDCELMCVNGKNKQFIDISIFPNPATDYINIHAGNIDHPMSLSIFDVFGREMHEAN